MTDDAAARDVLIQRLSTLASEPLKGKALAEATQNAETLVDELEARLPHDSWQWRTLAIALAQLRERSGDDLWAARAWLEVVRVASHRSEALPKARAAYLRAGAFDEWSELTNSKAPRMAPLLEHARTPGERALVLEAIPLLEDFFVESAGREAVFPVRGVDRKTLEALVKASHAPKARPFLKAFADDWTAPPLFDGQLAMAPARPCGFFVTGVDAKPSSGARALLARASSSTRRFSRVVATWETPHGTRAAPEPVDPERHAGSSFEAVVKRLLNEYLEESRSEVWSFTNAPFAVIEALGDELGDSFLASSANQCPSASELLESTRSKAKQTTFGGRVVWPPRHDAGVTIDTVTTPAPIPPRWLETADEVTKRGRAHALWWD